MKKNYEKPEFKEIKFTSTDDTMVLSNPSLFTKGNEYSSAGNVKFKPEWID